MAASTLLVVEDGSGVAGANTLVRPRETAEILAGRGFLTAESYAAIAEAVELDAAAFTLERAAGSWTAAPLSIEAGDILRLEGAAAAANRGFCYVDQVVSSTVLEVAWLELEDETVGAGDFRVTVFAQSGWWAAPRVNLEASLVTATDYVGSKHLWKGVPVGNEQGTPFPRRDLRVGPGSRYYRVGLELPDDEVPLAVRVAVSLAAAESNVRSLLETVDVGGLVKRKKVGPIEKEFFAPERLRELPHVSRELWGLYRASSMTRRISSV